MNDPFLSQMSAFEVVELQHLYAGLGNSTITIFMSALFAYILISQYIVSRVSSGQLVTISIIYSVFSLYHILGLVNVQRNAYYIQRHIMEIGTGSDFIVQIDSIAPLMVMPAICFLGWVVSIVYMRIAWQKK